MKVTIIGAGNMGGAAAIGIAKAGHIAASDITITCPFPNLLTKYQELGMNTNTDNKEGIKDADVVIVVVKPWVVPAVAKEIAPVLDFEKQVVVCMAPGVKEDELVECFKYNGEVPAISYVIPNIAIEYCESMNFIAPVTAKPEHIAVLEKMLEGTGTSLVVEPHQLQAGTCLASCGIAYALRYVHAASQGGTELGMFPSDAVKIVTQTMQGAVSLLRNTGAHPEAQIDKVTTAGGMTIKGLNAMEEAGFTASVIKGLKAGI